MIALIEKSTGRTVMCERSQLDAMLASGSYERPDGTGAAVDDTVEEIQQPDDDSSAIEEEDSD